MPGRNSLVFVWFAAALWGKFRGESAVEPGNNRPPSGLNRDEEGEEGGDRRDTGEMSREGGVQG